jgi:soluble lytic murein transglycosylase-like protein
MSRRTLVLSALISIGVARGATAQAAADQSALIDQFLSLERARQAPGATAADVERLLALMADSIVYEHPRARARLQGKSVLRQGMLNYLGTVRNATDSVVQRTMAPGVVVLVVESRGEMSREGRWEPLSRRALRVFELDGDRIRRIIDYGW